jgi:hypothetical protein
MATSAARDFAREQMLQPRQRASIVLSATGIVASLLGAVALRGSYSHPIALIALAVTAAGMVACIGVLWRVRDEGDLSAEGPGRNARWRHPAVLPSPAAQTAALTGG